LSNTTATARLKQDYIRLIKDPVPYVAATPLPSNILEWHYVVTGPEGTPYEGGLYHGKLLFPKQFPFRPPSIYMITPSGRFKTNTRLCLSISDFHPDSWNPAWTVASILTGLISFMVENTPTLGSIETTTQVKRAFAQQSLRFNSNDPVFCSLFPETARYIEDQLTSRAGANTEADNEENTHRVEDAAVLAAPRVGIAEAGNGNRPLALNGHVVNVCVFLGVAAFALTVKCVLSSAR